MRKPESSQNQTDHSTNTELTTAEFSVYPFLLFQENGRWQIEYFNIDFETFQNNRPKPDRIFRRDISFMLSILLLQPHYLISVAEWAQRAGRSTGSIEATKSRFKKELSQETQKLFPRVNGHIFVPPYNYLDLTQITDARPFSAHGYDFMLTPTGQFICLKSKKKVRETVFPGEESYQLPTVEYVLLEPSLSTMLSILIDNFGKYVQYEKIIEEYHLLKYADSETEIQKTDLRHVRVLRSRLLKVLPPQLTIKVGRGESIGLFST